jgi:hypothetical protein
MGGFEERVLLATAAKHFDALLTAAKNMEFQQNLATLPMSILVMGARSNRVSDLVFVVPAVILALRSLKARTLIKVAA